MKKMLTMVMGLMLAVSIGCGGGGGAATDGNQQTNQDGSIPLEQLGEETGDNSVLAKYVAAAAVYQAIQAVSIGARGSFESIGESFGEGAPTPGTTIDGTMPGYDIQDDLHESYMGGTINGTYSVAITSGTDDTLVITWSELLSSITDLMVAAENLGFKVDGDDVSLSLEGGFVFDSTVTSDATGYVEIGEPEGESDGPAFYDMAMTATLGGFEGFLVMLSESEEEFLGIADLDMGNQTIVLTYEEDQMLYTMNKVIGNIGVYKTMPENMESANPETFTDIEYYTCSNIGGSLAYTMENTADIFTLADDIHCTCTSCE